MTDVTGCKVCLTISLSYNLDTKGMSFLAELFTLSQTGKGWNPFKELVSPHVPWTRCACCQDWDLPEVSNKAKCSMLLFVQREGEMLAQALPTLGFIAGGSQVGHQ